MKRNYKSAMACLALIVAGVLFITAQAEAYSNSNGGGCKSGNGKSIGFCGGKDSDPASPKAPAPKHWHSHFHSHYHFHSHHHFHFHSHHHFHFHHHH
jgi:hypothetical protein